MPYDVANWKRSLLNNIGSEHSPVAAETMLVASLHTLYGPHGMQCKTLLMAPRIYRSLHILILYTLPSKLSPSGTYKSCGVNPEKLMNDWGLSANLLSSFMNDDAVSISIGAFDDM
ncbi:hypothetical protein T440DRAFT_483809 [Plenodomus tracheiphilus IPT5]|uniref:Uncharacterized protein n=1 Tax=Plenodomus tracheiphilus IPT5 TaxID=1408161 RepID=A0A6A7ARF0_9PLEO|nr:hypothetical protein T440DRAFT_483809 [Plenodomus tracheiphilus IPT5]